MLTLRMDGMLKVKKGVTTLEEVVKKPQPDRRGACQSTSGRCSRR